MTGSGAGALEQRAAIPRQAVWPAALVLVSLVAALLRQQDPDLTLRLSALAYVAPMIASICVAIISWIRFKSEPSGWWLGIASSFFLFFILTGQQFLLEAFRLNQQEPLAWQPWTVARLLLALGVVSASASGMGLLAQAGRSRRETAWWLLIMSAFAGPLWTRLLPGDLYWPAANGLSAVDSVTLVLGGLATVAAYLRIRQPVLESGGLAPLLQQWLLALAWSAACRALPLGSPADSAWVEMLVVGAASLALTAQMIWQVADANAASESRLASLESSREVLKCISTLPEGSISGVFLRTACLHLGADKASLLLAVPDEPETFVVAGEFPEGGTASCRGKRLSTEQQRRPGFWSGPAARAIKTGKTVAVDGVHSDVEFVRWRDAAQSQAYQLSLPVIAGGRVVGAALFWFVQGMWRPSVCVPVAEAVVDASSGVIARLAGDLESDSAAVA